MWISRERIAVGWGVVREEGHGVGGIGGVCAARKSPASKRSVKMKVTSE